MMDKSFVEALQHSSETKQFKIPDFDGKDVDVFSRAVFRIPLPSEPKVDTLAVSTLSAISEYFAATPDVAAESIIHVVDQTDVRIVSKIKGINRYRDTYMIANCASLFSTDVFALNRYYPLEQFTISLQATFVDGDDKAQLVRLLSTIVSEDVRTDQDDSMSQSVMIRNGLSTKMDVSVKNPWVLAPYRTFREITQPSSPFIVRLKQNGPGKMPDVALFEADGGLWKLVAIESIKTWFHSQLATATVVG